MATTTAKLGLTKPDPDDPDDDDAWAPMLNGDLDILDAAVWNAATTAADAAAAAAAANANADTRLPAAALPVGTSLEWNGAALPPGFLWEDGSNVSRTTYALLFAAIGTTFGAGNGSTTFTLPDSRGRTAVGRDTMGGTAAGRITNAISGIAGATLGAAGGDQRLHAHLHAIALTLLYDAFVPTGQGLQNPGNQASTGGATTTNAGSGNSQNVQPSIIKNKIIYAGV